MSFEPNDIPVPLRDAYARRQCSMYVGAGLSQGAGLPSWQQLLEELIIYIDQNIPAFRDRLDAPQRLGRVGNHLMLPQVAVFL